MAIYNTRFLNDIKQSLSSTSAFGELETSQFMPLTGWAFTYNINPALVDSIIVDTGTVVNNLGHADISTGSSATGLAEITTVRSSRYIPGVGGVAKFTAIFDTPQPDSKQVIGLINGSDGWAFGYDGIKFGILRKVNNVENWIYQEDWNVDKKVKLDHTKGNVYQIRYQWLGYGMQYFYIEDENGNLELVHTIEYANKNSETSILNPNLPMSAYVVNIGNTIPLTLRTPSAITGLNGDGFNDAISTNVGADVVATIPSSQTDYPLLAFRMGDTYFGKANRLFSQILRMIFATDGNKPVLFRVYSAGTVTGGTWDYLNEDISPLEMNNTMTSYVIGSQIGSFPLGRAESQHIDLIASRFRMYAGHQFVVTATNTTTSDVIISANWKSFV